MSNFAKNVLRGVIPALGGIICSIGSIGFGLSQIELDCDSELKEFATSLQPYSDAFAIIATTGAVISIASIKFHASDSVAPYFDPIEHLNESALDILEHRYGS